jgi:hypothetical protein
LGARRLRGRAHRSIAIALVASFVIAGAPAHAGQTKASKNPKVTGPLALTDSACGDKRIMHEGKPLAQVESCVFLYEFDTLMETDVTQTYGVAWVQTTVDPLNGWCVTSADSELLLPSSVERHGRTPTKAMSTSKRKRVNVGLDVTAGANALEYAYIGQGFDLYPKSLSASLANGGRTVRTSWKGSESSTLFSALGAEISWPVLSSPGRIRGGLGNMNFLKKNKC